MDWLENFRYEFPGFKLSITFNAPENCDEIRIDIPEKHLAIQEKVYFPVSYLFWELNNLGIPQGVYNLACELRRKI